MIVSCPAVRFLKASVIIPVRDESSNVGPICEAFARLMKTDSTVSEVIFVDDHSFDRTLDQIKSSSITLSFVRTVILNGQRGKGAAIRSGFEDAQSEVLVMMDGDQQYSPSDIPRLVEPIFAGSADLVVGNGTNHTSSIVRRMFSRSYRLIFDCMFGLPVSSPNEGLKAIVKTKFDMLGVNANGFDFDIELLVKAKMQCLRITETPIERHERVGGKSKVRVLPTTVRFFARMLRLWLSQRKLP